MDNDARKWKGLNGPLPGGNKPRNDPQKHEPQPDPPPQKKWQPGELPLSRPRQSGPSRDSEAFHHSRSDAPSDTGHEGGTRMDSVLPVYDDQQQEQRPTTVQERNLLWWMPVLGFAVVAGIILIVALIVMREPLSNLTQAHAYTQQKDMIAAKQQAEYAALDADVRAGIRQVQHALTNLDVRNQGLAAEAELRLGQPLQQLQSSPRNRPRELDLAILASKETATNWASLVNATAAPAQSRPILLMMSDLDARAREGRLIPADRDIVAGLLTLTAQQEELANKRAGQVQRLTESLAACKLEMALNDAERK
jgi:hypothetical protein